MRTAHYEAIGGVTSCGVANIGGVRILCSDRTPGEISDIYNVSVGYMAQLVPTGGIALELGGGKSELFEVMSNLNRQAHFIKSDLMYADDLFWKQVPGLETSRPDQKNLSYIAADVRELPFANETLDVIMAQYVLTYLNEADRKVAAQQIYSKLKVGGLAWFAPSKTDESFYKFVKTGSNERELEHAIQGIRQHFIKITKSGSRVSFQPVTIPSLKR